MPKRTITTEYERKDGEIVKKVSTEEVEPYTWEDDKCCEEPEIDHVIQYEEELSVLDVITGVAGIMLIALSACTLYKMFKK